MCEATAAGDLLVSLLGTSLSGSQMSAGVVRSRRLVERAFGRQFFLQRRQRLFEFCEYWVVSYAAVSLPRDFNGVTHLQNSRHRRMRASGRGDVRRALAAVGLGVARYTG